MKYRKIALSSVALIISLTIVAVAVLELLPSNAPSIAWKSRLACLQEPAIKHLKKKLHIGMTYEEMVAVMGKTSGVGDGNSVTYSYNVNFGFNRGLDITVKNGSVVEIFEYD